MKCGNELFGSALHYSTIAFLLCESAQRTAPQKRVTQILFTENARSSSWRRVAKLMVLLVKCVRTVSLAPVFICGWQAAWLGGQWPRGRFGVQGWLEKAEVVICSLIWKGRGGLIKFDRTLLRIRLRRDLLTWILQTGTMTRKSEHPCRSTRQGEQTGGRGMPLPGSPT